MTRFDKYAWKARSYKTPEDLDFALSKFGVKGKTIQEIHTIGIAMNLQPREVFIKVRNLLADEGVPYQDIDSGKYKKIDAVLLPYQVQLCEPVVILFEDGTTLEIQPDGSYGLRMSVNQIPPQVKDGLNHQNYDPACFFGRVSGAKILGIRPIRTAVRQGHSPKTNATAYRNTKWEFQLSGDFGLSFNQDYGGWFIFGVTLQRQPSDSGKSTAEIEYGEVKRALRHTPQILILERDASGGYFWIMPVRRVQDTGDGPEKVEECWQEEISIDEWDVQEFLFYFLKKYFDPNIPYGKNRSPYSGLGFEGDLEPNFYTYDRVLKMLKDIEQCAALLRDDYDNEHLSKLKKRFDPDTFDFSENRYLTRYSAVEGEKFIRDHIQLAIDFYDRFVDRMRKMLKAAPGYEFISFMGS